MDFLSSHTEQRVNIALKHRLGQTVAPFVKRAYTETDLHERISLVAPQVRKTAAEIAEDHSAEVSTVVEAAFAMLREGWNFDKKDKPEYLCDSCGEPEGDRGYCNKCSDATGTDADADDDSDENPFAKKAFLFEGADGDNYQKETVDLKGHDDSAGDVGSPKIDKGPYDPYKQLPKIDLDSKRNHQTQQHVDDAPTEEDWARFDEADGGNMITRVDADKPIGDTKGTPSSTWSAGEGNSAGQANPVTVESRYRVI